MTRNDNPPGPIGMLEDIVGTAVADDPPFTLEAGNHAIAVRLELGDRQPRFCANNCAFSIMPSRSLP